MSWQSDAALVATAIDDRPEAFEALVLRYQRKAFAIARAIGVRPDSLEDAVQEALIEAFAHLEDLRSPAAFGRWFLQIVRNVSRNHLKASVRSPASLADDVQSDAAAASDLEDAREIRERVEREVLDLPETLREAVWLCYYEDGSTRSVAQALGISRSAVKLRLKRGRDLLRERLRRDLGEALRDLLPSARGWRAQGKRLAIVVLGPTPISSSSGRWP